MSPNQRTTIQNWQSLMDVLGFGPNTETYQELVTAYQQNHRAYHDLTHVDACLRHLDAVGTQTCNRQAIELALWFHDAVYEPMSKTNEEDSANWAGEFLSRNAAPIDFNHRVCDLILLTKYHECPAEFDSQLMLDIDLSILGASPDAYEQFEHNVRKEYQVVPQATFQAKRRQILQAFLKRPAIYQTTYFFERLEDQARINLANAINSLGQG